MEVIQKEAFRIVGFQNASPNEASFWEILEIQGKIQNLMELTKQPIIYHVRLPEQDQIIGVISEEEFESLIDHEIPACTWVIFRVSGKISEQVLQNTWKVIHQFMDNHPLFTRNLQVPTLEEYRFWDIENDLCEVLIHIPIQ